MAMAIFVLQAFTIQGGTAGGAANQEASGLLITGSPGHVADPLETEHRVVDVERDHRLVVGAVTGSSSHPVRHGAQLVDTFLQYLTFAIFFIEGHLIGILRGVFLPFTAVNTNLTEQAFHTKGTGFIRDDRYHPFADLLVFKQRRQHPHKGHGGGNFAIATAFEYGIKGIQFRQVQLTVKAYLAARHKAVQRLAAGLEVFHLFGVFTGVVVRDVSQFVVADRNVETVTEVLDGFHVHFLDLVGNVFAFTGVTHAITFNGFGQDHGRTTLGIHRAVIGGVNLVRVMATTVQAPDVVIRHIGNHFLGFRVLTEEIVTGVLAAFGFVVLVLTVDGFFHDL